MELLYDSLPRPFVKCDKSMQLTLRDKEERGKGVHFVMHAEKQKVTAPRFRASSSSLA
jgi:hypothetical protein